MQPLWRSGGDPEPVARVEVTFLSGQRPNGQFDEPSALLLADKAEFGTSRVRRWFDRDWTSY
jgi:sulfide:quinone oxidoreductase